MDLILFTMLEKLFNFIGLDSFVYKTEAIVVLTSRVVLSLNEFIDV